MSPRTPECSAGFYPSTGKRALDLAVALPLLLLAAPLMLVVSVFVALDSRGPILFKQRRLGRNARPFTLCKFRSMTAVSRVKHSQVFGRSAGVTRVGYWLRRFKIDEVPQLLNVVRGDMSLVGPRPALLEQLADYDEDARRRLDVRPGLTGLAQVHGNIHLSWPQRWAYDSLYARQPSLWLDLSILARTIVVVLFGERRFLAPQTVPAAPRGELNPRIVLAGSVTSSRITLEALLRHKADVVGVLGLDPSASKRVSGYVRLADLAGKTGLPCREFTDINDPEIVSTVDDWAPDILFVVGLSQMVKRPLLQLPRQGTIGYHPTPLPQGRGRAPLVWLKLDGKDGAATFFEMTEEADAGGILVQEPFRVEPDAYIADVIESQLRAIHSALDSWLPGLIAGEWNPVPQDAARASWNARRAPADSCIDWHAPASEIAALVRAVSHPYPGAYTYYKGRKLIIWRGELETGLPIRGIPGRIVQTHPDRGSLVQTGHGLLWLTEVAHAEPSSASDIPQLTVGNSLGMAVEAELVRMAERIRQLERQIEELQGNHVSAPAA